MTLEPVVGTIALLWPLAEVALGLATRVKRSRADVRDRGSLVLLWIVISISITAASMLRLPAARMSMPAHSAWLISLVLLVTGLALRATAIITLGRFFSSNVAIHAGHQIVRAGLYRYVRHPSYTGALLAFAGLGFFFRNWLSLALILAPITAAFLYRIHVEEAALVDALGRDYLEYRRATRRLVPGVY